MNPTTLFAVGFMTRKLTTPNLPSAKAQGERLAPTGFTRQMKVLFSASSWTATLLIFLTLHGSRHASAADAFEQNRRLGRGVNLLGWDPIWKDSAQGQIKARHFTAIREAGFQHVRINLHPLRDGKPAFNGHLQPEFLQTMDWALDQALTNGLLAILDFHDDLAISPDPDGKRREFIVAWEAIAAHAKNRPETVLFEILNEPAPKFTPESWEEFWVAALAAIRKSNPNRTVIIGPDKWNGFGQLKELHLPDADRNLIATVHYYNPFAFTHQGTPWTSQKEKIGVTLDGNRVRTRSSSKRYQDRRSMGCQ